MRRAFRSEWWKFRRRPVLAAGLAMSFFAVLFVPLGIISATSGSGGNGFGPQAFTLAVLNSDKGLTTLLSRGSALATVIALVIVASSTALEYTHGTLRTLLVRQPDRFRFLTGKFAALVSYVVCAATLAFVLAVAAALITAPHRGVSTAAWTSGPGLENLVAIYGDLVFALVTFATLGYLSAIVFRATAPAVAVPVAHLLIVENLIGAVWSGSSQWLFGRFVSGVLNGESVLKAGADVASFSHGLVGAAVYGVVFLAVSAALFRYRDVTA